MIDFGKYDKKIEVWEKTLTDKTDDNGYKIAEYQFKKDFFAKIESRIGGLLGGRPADTVMSSVTHKISYLFKNFPIINPDTHLIKYQGHEFDVNYTLDADLSNQELQVFCTERIKSERKF